MKFSIFALGLLPLAMAGSLGDTLLQRSPGLAVDAQMRRAAGHALGARAASSSPAPSASATVVQPAGAPSQTDTNNACQSQLAKLNGNPSNPSGKSACYNVAAMDMTSGAFQTEVYLYDIGLPTGLWASLLNKGESISLTYPGGQVQGQGQRLAMLPPGGSPPLNASVLFTGQLNKTMMGMMNDVNAMRMALMPQINIKAETSDGQFLSVNMSNQEAAFINGVFSDPAFTASQAAAFAATGTPFVLPGTTFGIFPTGLIVTSIWTIFFAVAVGAGTVGRYNFRTAYRRRAGLGSSAPLRGGNVSAGKTAAYDRR